MGLVVIEFSAVSFVLIHCQVGEEYGLLVESEALVDFFHFADDHRLIDSESSKLIWFSKRKAFRKSN
jgi:hypothetical protein